MDRIDPDLFYDQEVVGLLHGTKRGHRGLPASRFFTAEDELAGRPHFLVRAAARPWVFSGVLFGFGFFAVFVRQAQILVQIILGAPIFEEMVKFGLAMFVSLALVSLLSALRPHWEHPGWMAVRLPAALAVGAGFGVLEHVTTYSSEGAWDYAWRVMFHGFSTGASMIAYQAALRSPDLRTRWFCLLPSIFIHYLNNYGAVVLGLGSVALPFLAALAGLMSGALVVLLGATSLAMLVLPGPTAELLERVAARLPVETRRGV